MIEFRKEQAHNRFPMDVINPALTVYPVAVIMDCRTLADNRWQSAAGTAGGVFSVTAVVTLRPANGKRRAMPYDTGREAATASDRRGRVV